MQDEDFEYVGFWARVLATIIDSIILIIVAAPALIAIYGQEYYTDYFTNPDAPLLAGAADFLISYVFPAVAIILFWIYRRATPGKMAISAQVVDARTGKSLGVGQAIGRYLAYFPACLLFFVGIIWVAFDSRKQGWHDKLAGTVVIRPKRRGAEPVKFLP